MDGHNLMAYADFAERLAQEAGSLIRSSLEARGTTAVAVEDKAKPNTASVDLVTETDKKAEEIILTTLREALPTHKLVGEESSFLPGIADMSDEPHWFIDPLDGTINYVHGYPFVTVSIGLWINKQPAVGIIYNPFLDEIYKAWKGGGAWLNGRRLQVASAKSLSHCLISTTLGSSREPEYADKLLGRLRGLLLQKMQGFRISGSTAQNIAHVANGRIDGYYDEGGYGGPWDVAAGVVLVQEAGGVVKSIDGGPFVLHMGQGNMVCGNETIVDEIVRTVQSVNAQTVNEEEARKTRVRITTVPLVVAAVVLLALSRMRLK